MKTIIAILTPFLLTACNACQPQGAPTHAYDRYITQFTQDIAATGRPVPSMDKLHVLTDNLGPQTLARCYNVAYMPTSDVYIIINSNAPYRQTDQAITANIYHELLHCYYGLAHVPALGLMHDGIPYQVIDVFALAGERVRLLREALEGQGR